MGIYLGPSPNHASSVHMILSLQTGHVSPQFHVYFDDMFKTIREQMGVPQSNWQNKTGIWNPTTSPGGARADIPTNSIINPSVSTYGSEPDWTTRTSEPRSTGEQTDSEQPYFGTDPDSQAFNEETVLDTSPEHVDLESVEARQQEENDSNPGVHPASSHETVDTPRLWSRHHKPTARLREYMGTLQSMTCLSDILGWDVQSVVLHEFQIGHSLL